MVPKIICKNCGEPASHKYCRTCGQKTSTARLDRNAFVEEITATFLNAPIRQFYTFRQLIIRPGETMLGYIDCKRKSVQSPVSYFVFAVVQYFLFAKYVLPNLSGLQGLKVSITDISHSTKFNDIPFLFLILLGMAAIGWLFCGYNWGVSGRRSFSYIESIVVFSFIYGSNFLFDTAVVYLEVQTPILRILADQLDKFWLNVITDIPLILVITLMAYDFCRAAGINIYRYLLTVVFGLCYYIAVTKLMTSYTFHIS